MSNKYTTLFHKLATTDHDTINYMEYANELTELLNYNEEILSIFTNFKCNQFPPIEII